LPGNPITFLPGGTSAFVQEPIQVSKPHIYTLRATAGQILIVSAASPDNDVFLEIAESESGEVLLSSELQDSDWTGTLPHTGEYRITLTTNSTDTYYFLSVEIPVNIIFEPGENSVFIEGVVNIHTDFYPDVMTRVRYLVQVKAGQTLDVVLSSPNLDALSMGVTGQTDGQPYLRNHVKNSGFSGALPTAQGYYLDVYAVGGELVSFTLTVAVQ
jgi:hypothetical protein